MNGETRLSLQEVSTSKGRVNQRHAPDPPSERRTRRKDTTEQQAEREAELREIATSLSGLAGDDRQVRERAREQEEREDEQEHETTCERLRTHYGLVTNDYTHRARQQRRSAGRCGRGRWGSTSRRRR